MKASWLINKLAEQKTAGPQTRTVLFFKNESNPEDGTNYLSVSFGKAGEHGIYKEITLTRVNMAV